MSFISVIPTVYRRKLSSTWFDCQQHNPDPLQSMVLQPNLVEGSQLHDKTKQNKQANMRNNVTKKVHTIVTKASRSTLQFTTHHPLLARAMRGKRKAHSGSRGRQS